MSITRDAASAGRGPHTLVLLFAFAALVALVVPFVPAGYFVAGEPMALTSFRWAAEPVALGLFAAGEGTGFLNFVFDGLTSGSRDGAAVGVIAFVLIVGGAFGIVNATGVIERGLMRLVTLTGSRPWLLLAVLIVAFSTGGAVFGMGEETIAFLALLLPVLRRLGYPPEVAVMVTYVASQVGFASSWMNPFSVAVAQGIAGLPLLSGAPLRIAMWAGNTAIAIAFVLVYAARRRVPAAAAAGGDDFPPMQRVDLAILAAIAATVAWIVWGVSVGGYYIAEIATQFLTLGLVAGLFAMIAGRLTANAVAEAFSAGAAQLVPCALVIACAKGLLGLLGGSDPQQPSVLNTLLYGLGGAIGHWPEWLAAQGMLAAQTVFTFFVTSGSAQAAITMPLMAGLGDLVGVTRQVAVLAFQLGDGIANIVVPTSAALMGAVGVARLDFLQWFRAVWRLEVLLLLASAAWVALAVAIGYR